MYKSLEFCFGVYSVKAYAVKAMVINLGCDVSKIKKELGFEPRIGLNDGIARTIAWLKDNVKEK
jgi:nucleoside-diphosphate-sugar epimerase